MKKSIICCLVALGLTGVSIADEVDLQCKLDLIGFNSAGMAQAACEVDASQLSGQILLDFSELVVTQTSLSEQITALLIHCHWYDKTNELDQDQIGKTTKEYILTNIIENIEGVVQFSLMRDVFAMGEHYLIPLDYQHTADKEQINVKTSTQLVCSVEDGE